MPNSVFHEFRSGKSLQVGPWTQGVAPSRCLAPGPLHLACTVTACVQISEGPCRPLPYGAPNNSLSSAPWQQQLTPCWALLVTRHMRKGYQGPWGPDELVLGV